MTARKPRSHREAQTNRNRILNVRRSQRLRRPAIGTQSVWKEVGTDESVGGGVKALGANLETMSPACSRPCSRNTRNRARSSIAFPLVWTGCNGTLSRCKSRWQLGKDSNEPTLLPRWSSTRHSSRASSKPRSIWRAQSTICTSYVAQRFMWRSPWIRVRAHRLG